MEHRTADFGASITKVREVLKGVGIQAHRIQGADLEDMVHGTGDSCTNISMKMKPVLLELGDIVARHLPTYIRAS